MGTDRGGYGHPSYAAALAEFGAPRALPRSGGTLLVREIDGAGASDAMGAYPLFACDDWGGLAADLQELEGELVSVALVADPFGGWTVEQLSAAFPDRQIAFKEHHVVDLADGDPVARATKHHRQYARRGLRAVAVEEVADPPSLLDEWDALYGGLVARHGITGISAFSRASFAGQLAVPGIVAFRATALDDGELAGAALWYLDGDVAYWHLAAYSECGYRLDASYALMATALERFAQPGGPRWAGLGAGAGVDASGAGLDRFKAGWATETRTAHFCGRILDHARYRALSPERGDTAFFPAYRAGGAG